MCAFKDVSNVLGDVEASEKSSDILVRRLPRQSSGSDHRVVTHFLHFTAAHTHTHTGIITVDYQGTKITCIFNKCYSPSAALELLTNSLGVRKRVACNSKVTESP